MELLNFGAMDISDLWCLVQ